MKFRKRPIVIEAIQYKPKITQLAGEFLRDCCCWIDRNGNLIIETLEGKYVVTPNDWIIKGVKGEFYPVKNDIFEMTYEPVLD